MLSELFFEGLEKIEKNSMHGIFINKYNYLKIGIYGKTGAGLHCMRLEICLWRPLSAGFYLVA